MRTITLAPDTAARWHRSAAVFETLLRRSAAGLVLASATTAVVATLAVDGWGWLAGADVVGAALGLVSAIGLGAVGGAVLAFLASPVLALVAGLTLVPRRPRRVVEVMVGCWTLASAVWFSAEVLDNRAGEPYRTPVLFAAVLAAGVLAKSVPRRYDEALDAVEARLPVV